MFRKLFPRFAVVVLLGVTANTVVACSPCVPFDGGSCGRPREIPVGDVGDVATTLAATTTTATTVTRSTATTAAPGLGLSLAGDGLGIVPFGAATDVVLLALENRFGPPTSAGRDMYRVAQWDELGLTLLFSDAHIDRSDGIEHFVGWIAVESDRPLVTSEGVAVGAPAEALLTAHGGDVTVPAVLSDECMPSFYVWLDNPGPEIDHRILVTLDGPVDDATSRITSMSAGASYGC